jgi:hypothetical protein
MFHFILLNPSMSNWRIIHTQSNTIDVTDALVMTSDRPGVEFASRGTSPNGVSPCPFAFNLILLLHSPKGSPPQRRKIVLHRDCTPQRHSCGVCWPPTLPAPSEVHNPRCPVASRCPIALPWPVCSYPLLGPRQGYDVPWLVRR